MSNFFEFFDLPVRIEIDEKELKKRYLRKSREFHPDFINSEDKDALEKAERMSAHINAVYKTLSDRQERISYILLMYGLVGEQGQNQMPQDFLMEVMDINEAIMDLQFDPDDQKKAVLVDQIHTFKENVLIEAKPFFEKFDAGDHSAPILEGVRDYFLKNKYFLRMEENLKRSTKES